MAGEITSLLNKALRDPRSRRVVTLACLVVFIVLVGAIVYVIYWLHSAGALRGGSRGASETTTPPWGGIIANKTVVLNRTHIITATVANIGNALGFVKDGVKEYNRSFAYSPYYPGYRVFSIPVSAGDTVLVIVTGRGFDEKIVRVVLLERDTHLVVSEIPIEPAQGSSGYGVYKSINYAGYVDVYIHGYIHAVSNNVVFTITVLVLRG